MKASIIIPVYNEVEELKKVLSALQEQTVNLTDYEIIVVDNGSTDNTGELVKSFKYVKYIIEDENLNSPYSCRNRGLEIAIGDVIVLLDGTCIPEKDWLEKGLNCFANSGADIISSNVRFNFNGRVTAGKLYDSNNLSTETAIKKRGVAKTASLFIKKGVFDVVGKFPEGVRSGADVRWTKKASDMGFKLAYCNNSIAWKKARTFSQSLKKQWRVGKGQPAIWKELGQEINPFKRLISSLIPYNPQKVNRLAANKGVEVTSYLKFKLYFVAYIVWITMSLANIYGTWLMRKDTNKMT